MGRNGVSFSSVNLDSIDNARGIDSSTARLAFDAGRSAYLAETAEAEKEKHTRAATQKKAAGKHINETNGVEYSSNIKVKKTGDQVTAITVTDKNGNTKDITLNARQKAGIQAAEMLASMGLNVHVFLSQTDANGKPVGENGSYSLKDGSIHIDLNAGNSGQGVMAYTIAHEFTHFMEQQSPNLFQQFTDALFASVDMDVEAEIAAKAEKLRQQRPDAYRNASKQKLMDDARSEVVAECCETMLTDTDAAERIARNIQAKDKTLWEKVVQWFRDLGNRMREAYKGLDPDSQIASDAKKTIQQVDSLVQMWADMAVDAAENYRNAEAASNSNLSDGTMLSITRTKAMSWGQQIRSLLNGNGKVKHMDTLVAMNNTPQYLKNDGVQDLPLAIPISVITKAQNEKNGSHKVSDQNLIALRYGMDNSIAVIDNPGRNSLAFITPLTEIVGEETENVCAFFDKNAVFDNDKVHRATSIHSRADISGMLDKLSDDAVIYVKNKNEFESLVGMADSIPAAYKSKIKFVSDNVAQDDGTVKRSERDSSEKEITELQQFKRWFGASKIVDETGAPKVLYHQTNADFTIFDTHHEGAGSRDQDTPFGIFMKESNANIGLRGEKQMALYAKIENPIVVQDREDLMYKLRKLSSEYAEISKEHRRLDDDYHARYEEATETLKQYMHDWRREHPNASRKALWDDAEFVRLYDAEHNVLDEWEAEARKIETQSKEVITSALEDAGYDGVIIKNDKGSFGRSTDAYIALHPEQVKSATDNIGTFDINNPDIRFSDRYSYHSLASKPDMSITNLDSTVPKSRADVVYQAKQNARKIGKFNTSDGSVSVYVKDVGKDVILGTSGLKHGLDRRMDTNAAVTLKAGEILSNSIQVNELNPEKEEADASYVLIGAANGDNGELYVVRSVVNQFSNELASMDVLYAMNAKKGNRLRSMRPGFQGPVTDSKISISDLLDYVNEYFPEVLPEDVLKHYGHEERPDGKLGKSALFSDRESTMERQNERLKADIANLKELVKLQGTVTEGKIARPETLTTAANAILKDAMRTMDAKDKPGLIRALEILFHDANTPEMSATTIEGSLMDVTAYIDRLRGMTMDKENSEYLFRAESCIPSKKELIRKMSSFLYTGKDWFNLFIAGYWLFPSPGGECK